LTEAAPTPPAAKRHIRTYQPLVPAAMAFVIGIVAGDSLGGGMALWCGVALAAGAVWLVFYLRKASERALLAALLVLLAAAGAARFRASVDPPPHDLARLAPNGQRLVTLEGTMVRSAQQASPPADVFLPSAQKPARGSQQAAAAPFYIRSNFLLEARRVSVDGKWFPADGRVRVVVREALPPPASRTVELGDAVRVVGMLTPFGEPTNPGGFDAAAYLRRQGIRTSLSTGHWEAIRVTEPAADRALWAIGAMRRWTLSRLDVLPSRDGQAVAAAMLFGRRDLLDFDSGQVNGQDIERAFVATGTVHFMAVSGFNVAMVTAPVLILLRLLGAGRKVTSVVVAVVALAFVLVTELEPPVLRAGILAWVVCLGWFMGRPAINLNTFGIGVLLVLLARPGDLFTTSFQLSFLAVLGMIFLVKKVEGLVAGRFTADGLYDPASGRGFWSGTVLRGTLLVSVAATMITVPVIAYRFHLVGWMAPIATAVLVGLVFALTVGGMALVALGWIAPWLSDVLAALTDGLGRTIAAVVLAMAKAPGAYFYLPEFSPAWVLVAYGLMAVWVWRERLGVTRRRLAMAVLAAAALFAWTTGHRAPAGVRATFLAVGSGNTTLLELPGGRNILYDTGSTLSYPRAGEAAVAPALWSRGITRVDAVFLSHAHFDHFKDILPLVERFGIRRVFVPPTFMRKRLKSDDAVVEALVQRGVRVELFGAGDRLAGTGATEIAGLWPRGPKAMTKAINSGSLVLAVGAGGRRLLLTGDIGPPAIDAFLEAEPRPRADAMLWPHHGHDPAAVERLATAAGAKVLVISSGRTVAPIAPPAWLKERGAACYHTGNDGAVTVDLLPEGLRVATFATGVAAEFETEPAADEDAETEDD